MGCQLFLSYYKETMMRMSLLDPSSTCAVGVNFQLAFCSPTIGWNLRTICLSSSESTLMNFLITNMPFVCLSTIAIWILYTRARGRQKTDGWRERSGFWRKKAPLSHLPGQTDVWTGRLRLQGSLTYWAEPLRNKYALSYICLCL